MSTEHEEMSRDTGALLRAALQAALLLGEHFARTHATRARQAAKDVGRDAQQKQVRLRAERSAAEAQLRLVGTEKWFEQSDRAKIADAWCTAVAWRGESTLAADTAAKLRARIQERYGFDPESRTVSGALAQTVPQMEEALAQAAWRRYRARGGNEAVLDQVVLQHIRDDIDRSALAAFVALHDQASHHLEQLALTLDQERTLLETEGEHRDGGGRWLSTEQHRRRMSRIAELEGRDPTDLDTDSDGQPRHRDRWSVDPGVTLSADEFRAQNDNLIRLEDEHRQQERQDQLDALAAAENAIRGLGPIGQSWIRQYDLSPDRAYAAALVAPDRATRDKMWMVGRKLAAAEGELAVLTEAGHTGTADAVAAAQRVQSLEKQMSDLGEAGARWVSVRRINDAGAVDEHDRTLAWIVGNPVVEHDALAGLRAEVAGEPAPSTPEQAAPTAGQEATAPKTKPARQKTEYDLAMEWVRVSDPEYYRGLGWSDTRDGARIEEREVLNRWRTAGEQLRKSKLGDLMTDRLPDEIRFGDAWADAETTYRRLIRAGADPRTLVQAARQVDFDGVSEPVELTIGTLRAAAGPDATAKLDAGGNAAGRTSRRPKPPKVTTTDAEVDAARAYFAAHDPEQLDKWDWKLGHLSTGYGRDSVFNEMVLRHRSEIHDTPEYEARLAAQLDAEGADPEAKAARLIAHMSNAKPAAHATRAPSERPQARRDNETGIGARATEIDR